MSRAPKLIALLLALVAVAGCQKTEEAPVEAAPVQLTAPPPGSDDLAWKDYLGKVVAQNMAGVTDRVFPYYLPENSTTPDEADMDKRSQYDRQLEQVRAAVQRTVLPGNMLAFGSPDSETMANMILAAFEGAPSDALAGSQVLFIGDAGDGERIRAAVEASGARYIFVESK